MTKRYWRRKSQRLGGRPQIGADLQALIRQMSVENLLWGAPRIHGELLKLGFARRKPARCQRTTVSGRMIVMALRTDGNQRYSWMNNSRSQFAN
jgi:hypothetical protein